MFTSLATQAAEAVQAAQTDALNFEAADMGGLDVSADEQHYPSTYGIDANEFTNLKIDTGSFEDSFDSADQSFGEGTSHVVMSPTDFEDSEVDT